MSNKDTTISSEMEEEHACCDQYCSFAVTGPQTSFQSIFVCYTCSLTANTQQENPPGEQQEAPSLHCVCQACADACHADHDGLEYFGIGPSYCDCQKLNGGCKIKNISEAEALRLNVPVGTASSALPAVACATAGGANYKDAYVREAYTLPILKDAATVKPLQGLAHQLVERSKETFWLDESMDVSSLCDLEKLAWVILSRHKQHYCGLDQQGSSSSSTTAAPQVRGGEWWVQVKPISYPPAVPASASARQQHSVGATKAATAASTTEAIDLHYDKDEALAQHFGLASFPALSTVTYLTDCPGSPPTVVLSRRYDEEEGSISDVMVSHPRRGKHIVFDGRLLHGAPAHYSLREAVAPERNGGSLDEDSYRITFLVNIWLDHKPAGVFPLPDEIREHLKQFSTNGVTEDLSRAYFESRPVRECYLSSEKELGWTDVSRVDLPFVGKDTTWGDDAADDCQELVVSLYAPPVENGSRDTLFYRYGPTLCGYVHTPAVADHDDDDEMEDTGTLKSKEC